ncbi:MAG TPA: hypothetical protein VG675_08260 [Bryobacteraceae bacterium]|nr:hypothetical protein [Bryobacteraceae bacterium]
MIAKGIVLSGLLSLCLVPIAAAAVVQPYLEVNGREAASNAVQVSRNASQITATFQAPRDGNYSFGLSLAATELSPLTPGMEPYNCASVKEPVIIRYPYDWITRKPAGDVLTSRARLVMPGVKADGQIYLVDTHELFSLKVEPCSKGNVRVLLLAHRFFNAGGDRATPELHLRAGEKRQFVVRLYKDIAAVNRDRFGTHDLTMKGYMTSLDFLEYAEDTAREADSFFSAAGKGDGICCRNLTAAEWGMAAQKLDGVFRYAVIRDKISNIVAPPFHKHGELVYHYEYMGAWRRHSPDVTPEIEKNYALRDVKGQLYMAPRSPDGVFLLVDIRRPEVRARLVNDARSAVRAGFDGIFLDGWPFWTDATGDIGGNVPSATESWAYARWQLLTETKAAMRAENPKATLGILANRYWDSLGIGDWLMKEFIYGGWYSVERTSGNSRVGTYQPETGTRIFQKRDGYEDEAAYSPAPIAFGAKGFSPIAVQSSIHFVRHPSGLYYVEAGTFPASAMGKYIDTINADVKQADLYVTNIQPETCVIQFAGKATMQSKARCTVKFSRSACITPLPNGKPTGGLKEFTLEPGTQYNVSRECGGASGK